MTAQEMEGAGLVTKILPKENFFEEVMKIAQRVVAQPPEALKVCINQWVLQAGIRLLG
jgi:Delta3-Delta2-enoyl-CoA isomerase